MTSDLHSTLLTAIQQRMEVAKAFDFWEPQPVTGTGCYDCGGVSAEEAAHSNLNDPATILRHCERDLDVVERHRGRTLQGGRGCSYDGLGWPCVEVRILARAYGVEVSDG